MYAYNVIKSAVALSMECSSTLHVGLTGTFRTLIQKSTGMVPPFLRFFGRLKRSSGYMGAANLPI